MELAGDIALFAGLVMAVALGGLLTVFQLPGTWFIVVLTAGYAWCYGFEAVGWPALAVMLVIAATAEVGETLAAMAGAKRAGASRGAAWGALLGGFAGMIIFTPLIPIPIVGSVAGGLIGCFAGAFVIEYNATGCEMQGTRVGVGAAIGRIFGLLVKLTACFVLGGIAVGYGVINLRTALS